MLLQPSSFQMTEDLMEQTLKWSCYHLVISAWVLFLSSDELYSYLLMNFTSKFRSCLIRNLYLWDCNRFFPPKNIIYGILTYSASHPFKQWKTAFSQSLKFSSNTVNSWITHQLEGRHNLTCIFYPQTETNTDNAAPSLLFFSETLWDPTRD